MSSSSTTTRRPYTGSCHCGAIKYIAHITLPTSPSTPITSVPPPFKSSPIYKCNCTVCTKMGIFHLRFPSAPDDFVLLSPLLGTEAAEQVLGDYQCNKKRTHWYFCRTCGVRCFSLLGEGELADVDLEKWKGADGGSGELTTVWRPKKDAWKEFAPGSPSYLSLNAVTLDQNADGPDLRTWTENKWVVYLDAKERTGEKRLDRPHEGGIY